VPAITACRDVATIHHHDGCGQTGQWLGVTAMRHAAACELCFCDHSLHMHFSLLQQTSQPPQSQHAVRHQHCSMLGVRAAMMRCCNLEAESAAPGAAMRLVLQRRLLAYVGCCALPQTCKQSCSISGLLTYSHTARGAYRVSASVLLGSTSSGFQMVPAGRAVRANTPRPAPGMLLLPTQ
jgi:hypothetical protein